MKRKKALSNIGRYVLPSVVALMVNSVYIIVDGFFVMKGVGEKALAAVTLSVPFLEALIAVSMLISVGAGIYISYYLGKKQNKTANEILNLSLGMLIGVSLIISVLGLIFIKKIAYFLGAGNEMTELVCDYLKYLLIFSPALILSYALATYLRNDNNPNLGMIGMIFGGLVNGVLDYVFIFVLDMGIEGAGLATGLGPVFSIIIMLPHFIFGKGALRLKLTKFSMKFFNKILMAGVPAFITEYSLGIVTYLHNAVIIKKIGEQGVAAYGIIGYVALVVLTLYLGTSQGIQPLISLSFGRKKEEELKSYMGISLILVILMGVVSTILVMIFSKQIVEIFSGDNIKLTKITVSALRLYSFSFIAAGINILIISILQSIQKSKTASLIAIIRSTVFVFAALKILPAIIGNTGIWIAMPVVEIITLLMIFSGYFILKHKKKSVAAV